MRRNKKPKAHKEKIFIDPSPGSFELAFQMRLGQTPLEWVKMKVEGGSQLETIQYLFEISAAEIAKEHGRTKGGIEARLVKLGRISKSETADK